MISGLELTGLRIEGNLAGKIEMKMEMVGEETIRNGITVASVPWSNRSGLHIQINIEFVYLYFHFRGEGNRKSVEIAEGILSNVRPKSNAIAEMSISLKHPNTRHGLLFQVHWAFQFSHLNLRLSFISYIFTCFFFFSFLCLN